MKLESLVILAWRTTAIGQETFGPGGVRIPREASRRLARPRCFLKRKEGELGGTHGR